MNLWHLTPDTPRLPRRVSPDERVTLVLGTWPIEAGQTVYVNYLLEHPDGSREKGRVAATWQHNAGGNSYWHATLGPFRRGDTVRYVIHGRSPAGKATGPSAAFKVGARLRLALMWHQHQPLYKDTRHPTPAGSYRQPWVRLHAIRDYYSMAALIAEHPELHVTINLTPALLWQLEDYLEGGATDRALDLTVKPAEQLTGSERAFLLSKFFDAHWHNQIYPHPRYRELFEKRVANQAFTIQDLRDLQMWFNLAWFGQEFRQGSVELVTGVIASVQRFARKQRDFNVADIEAMITEQYKIMRAVIPIHRQLQDQGQLEVATSPFYHPILPLLIDTDQATIDRPGTSYPRRFAHPEDAEVQIQRAVAFYQRHFGRSPRGMWPAEGAVSQAAMPFFARAGLSWIATDREVLARSGDWGYDVDKPEVLCQPYRAEADGHAISVFFRDTYLSNEIGFHYQGYSDHEAAAQDFLKQIRRLFIERLGDEGEHVLTIILDGENAWGAYRNDARPFLHALYRRLEAANDLVTVTFGEYLSGNSKRNLDGHPLATQTRVHKLFTGSWIDENGSAPGVDLGTWIGEEEENRAWELLGEARNAITKTGTTVESAPEAFEALYMAEGSDWFWWFGDDQDSGNDAEFDDLFRTHLKNVYRGLGLKPPTTLDISIVTHTRLWTFTHPFTRMGRKDRLTVLTNCPGTLHWQFGDGSITTASLRPAGGVMAGVRRYHLTLDPFEQAGRLHFRFTCTHPGCDGAGPCCRTDEHLVDVT